MKIRWDQIVDRHCFGECPLAKFWIRFDREDEVIGLYVMWSDRKEKYVPQNKSQTLIRGIKRLAQEILDNEIKTQSLIQ